MKRRFFPFLIGAVILFVVALVVQKQFPVQGKPRVLLIYTHSSFASQWGAGPHLAEKFEERCNCRVILLDVAEGGLILQRLELESDKSKADMVVGLDQLHISDARRMLKWQPLKFEHVQWSEHFPQQLIFSDFVPYNWAPLSLIYKKREHQVLPRTIDDLLKPDFKNQIALQDPRTSTGGLQFLYWILGIKGVEAGFDFLARLKPNIHSVSPSWSTAYGMFQHDQAGLVFSYLTSPVYHWTEEKDETYQPLTFNEGHIYQLEYAAVLKTCRECQLAQEFARFLLEKESQQELMRYNTMLPVIRDVEVGTAFEKLPQVRLLPLDKIGELSARKQELLDRWSQLGM